jgi:hypothetical protein
MKRKAKPQPETKQPDFEIDTIYDEIAEEEVADWYITGFPRDDPNLLWYEAMDAFETRGYFKQPLIEMLLDFKREVTPAVRECLVDLLQRYKFVRLRGKQQIPIYAMSAADTWLLLFTDKVLALTKNGTPQKEAIRRVASFWGVDEDTLANAVIGKRGSLRRALNNLARLTSKQWVHKRGWRKTKLKAKLENRAFYDLNLTLSSSRWRLRKKPIRSRTRH